MSISTDLERAELAVRAVATQPTSKTPSNVDQVPCRRPEDEVDRRVHRPRLLGRFHVKREGLGWQAGTRQTLAGGIQNAGGGIDPWHPRALSTGCA
jgi:hypothetical protein